MDSARPCTMTLGGVCCMLDLVLRKEHRSLKAQHSELVESHMKQSDFDISSRRSTRLPDYDYGQAGAYFVTINAYHRKMLFGQIREGTMVPSSIGKMVQSCWEEIPLHFAGVEMDAFVMMPNHIHGVVVIGEAGVTGVPDEASEACLAPTGALGVRRASPSLAAIVGSFKSACSRRVRRIGLLHDSPLWQRNYYEHVIRNDADLNDVREYILGNPVRWLEDKENPNLKQVPQGAKD